MRMVATANHAYMAFGRFLVTALYGVACGFHDLGITCHWGRFTGALVPLLPLVCEFVEQHGINNLLQRNRNSHGLSDDGVRAYFCS